VNTAYLLDSGEREDHPIVAYAASVAASLRGVLWLEVRRLPGPLPAGTVQSRSARRHQSSDSGPGAG